MVEDPDEIDVWDFVGREGEEAKLDRASSKKIPGLSAEFAGARSAEDESGRGVFEELVNLIEQDGDLLDLVDDDNGRSRREDLPSELTRPDAQLGSQLGVQEIVERRFGELLVEEGGLSRLSWAPQERGRGSRHGVGNP